MTKILTGSRFAVMSHRFQKLIPILIWGFRIFSNSRTIMRSKSTRWKAYSNNQTIAYKKKRGCWFTHFTMTTVSATNSGRVWFRLSFGTSKIERRRSHGGVADWRVKQRVRTSFRALFLFWRETIWRGENTKNKEEEITKRKKQKTNNLALFCWFLWHSILTQYAVVSLFFFFLSFFIIIIIIIRLNFNLIPFYFLNCPINFLTIYV